MKYRLGLIIGLLAGCGGPSSISHHGWKNKVKEDPVIEAQEVYFEFEPRTGMVFLRGYAPSVKNPEAVDAESGNLARYVKENRACREIWNFNGLVPVGERGFIRDAKRPDILVIECVLKPDSDNFGYIFEDLISHLARTDVIVSGGQGGFSVNYFGSRIKLSDHNADGHYKMKGAAPGEGRSLIFWKYKLEKYQGVIGARNPGYKHHLDAARFADTLKSAGFDARLRVE